MNYLGKPLLTAHGLEYMVHPQARSSVGSYRIAAQWVRHARDAGFCFAAVFPNSRSYRILTGRKVGFRTVVSPLLMVRPLPRIRVPRGVMGKVPPTLLTLGARILAGGCSARSMLRNDKPSGRSFVIKKFDERFDDLWERAKSAFAVGTWRDAAYLNWRYGNHPLYSYLRIGWKNEGRVTGFVVASQRCFDIPTMLIVDMLTQRLSSDTARWLIRKVVAQARRRGCQMVAALAIPSSFMHRTLKEAGFVSVPPFLNPKPFVLTVHDFGHDLPLIESPLDWHFTWGDMDVV